MKIITWWILGFVIGFACAELAVFLHTGDFIKLSDWRKPHYIHSLSDLVDNVKRAAIYLLKHVHFFSKTTQVLCMAAILNAGWKWLKGDRHATWILVLLLLIAVSAYAQTIPAGIHIELRNTTCLFLAIITLIFFSFCNKKPPLVACAILVSLPLYQHNVNNIDFLGSIMRVWETELEKIPVLPQSVEGIVLIHSTKELKRSEDVLKSRLNVHPVSTEEGLGKAWAWISVPYEVGFRRIHSTLDKDFLTKIALDPGKVERFERCGIYEYAVLDNWLLVRFAQ